MISDLFSIIICKIILLNLSKKTFPYDFRKRYNALVQVPADHLRPSEEEEELAECTDSDSQTALGAEDL